MVINYSGKPHSEPSPKPPVAKDFMTRSVFTVREDANIYDAIDLVVKKNLTGVPVVDASNRLVGFLSEKDCLPLITADAYHPSQPAEEVSRFMTRDVIVVEPDTGLVKVSELFMEHPFKKIPVVEGKRLVGLVKLQDVMRVILNQKKTLRPHTTEES